MVGLLTAGSSFWTFCPQHGPEAVTRQLLHTLIFLWSDFCPITWIPLSEEGKEA